MANHPMTVAEVLQALTPLKDQMPKLARGAARRDRATGDARDGAVYLMDDGLLLAVQVAVATGRPLLLTGDPGTGKSSLAAYLSGRLNWRYYEHVVTGRTEATDLLWHFDTLRKLGDASGRPGLLDSNYVEPGALWWALDREGARQRGASARPGPAAPAAITTTAAAPALEPAADLNAGRSAMHAVVLIDEIDKADPDVPNALLVPLGSGQFVVRETQTAVQSAAAHAAGPPAGARAALASPVLVVITSNGERELPPAFVRRCVTHQLDAPSAARLEQIARAHAALEGRKLDKAEGQRVKALAAQAVTIRDELHALGRKGAGTAEFLDAVRASRELNLGPDSPDWARLISLTLRKGVARP